MKWYFKLLILLAVLLPVGALIATLGAKPSYMLIAYDNSILETNLKFAFLVLTLVTVISLFLFYVIYKTMFFSKLFFNWKRNRKIKYAEFQIKAGALALAEGKWQQAEQQFRTALSNQDEQLMAYFGAARAANHQGHHVERDEYLEKAKKHVKGSELASGITLAELQLESGQLNECLETLKIVRSKSPSHPYALSLLQQAHVRLKDWDALMNLMPQLKKHKAMGQAELAGLEKKVYIKQFQQLSRNKRLTVNNDNRDGFVNDLKRIWESRPKNLKNDAELLKAFVAGILLLGADEQAEAILNQNLAECWSSDLVILYGKLAGDSETQLAKAKSWLNNHADDESLQLSLGRISLRAGDQDAAKQYFEASLELHKNLETFQELGKLMASQGDLKRSNEYLLQSIA